MKQFVLIWLPSAGSNTTTNNPHVVGEEFFIKHNGFYAGCIEKIGKLQVGDHHKACLTIPFDNRKYAVIRMEDA